MESFFKTEKEITDHIKKNNYLVLFPDKKVELFSSLRKIQEAIQVDSSTISKKLSNNEHIVISRLTKFVFYITKLS